MKTPKSLLASLAPEMFQTEQSAITHCAREADRLGDAPEARGMRAVSRHATLALPTLKMLATARRWESASAGRAIGTSLSELRDKIADRIISSESSYRGTLMGMRHGFDLFTLARATAQVECDLELASFCETWLGVRGPLIEQAADTLQWFARHPARAMQRAVPVLGGLTVKGAPTAPDAAPATGERRP